MELRLQIIYNYNVNNFHKGVCDLTGKFMRMCLASLVFLLIFCDGVIAKENITLSNLRFSTGEEITEDKDGYKATIYSNENEIMLIFDCNNEDGNNIVAIREDNSICGKAEVCEYAGINIKLHEGINAINIIDKIDGSNIEKLTIDYKRVEVSGIVQKFNVGDKIKLDVDFNDEQHKVKWMSYGIDSLIISEDGEVTAINGGVANLIGMIYDGNKIIGTVKCALLVVGDGEYGWIKNGGQWYYIDPIKKCFKIGKFSYNGKDYYFGKDGSMIN